MALNKSTIISKQTMYDPHTPKKEKNQERKNERKKKRRTDGRTDGRTDMLMILDTEHIFVQKLLQLIYEMTYVNVLKYFMNMDSYLMTSFVEVRK